MHYFSAVRPRMESVAAARGRLRFQSFGTSTAGLHDRETKARLVHQRCAGSGVQESTPSGVSVFQQDPTEISFRYPHS